MALILAIALLPAAATAEAVSSRSSSSMSSGSGPRVSVETSGKGQAFADGVSIVGGEITIEGARVPHDARRFTARSGRVYAIERSGGRISVRSVDPAAPR
jgi:hypothetical protein